MKKAKSFQKNPEKRSGTEREGLLVGHFGTTAEVETVTGEIIRCHLPKNLTPVMTGDRVLFRPEHDAAGVVVTHLPRSSALSRPERNGRTKLIAANVDTLIIVNSPPPSLSTYLIDRYLVAAENVGITPVILLNKMDLLSAADKENVLTRLAVYEKIGYTVLFSSTVNAAGLDTLLTFLQTKVAVLVGPSGVGKSSLIAKFLPLQTIKTAETSAAGAGKHTTTMTRLYHLPTGGDLIDSPGIREFGLWDMSAQDILRGFTEFSSTAQACKFRNCQHVKEPECGVQQAVLAGEISLARFESYKEMLEECCGI